MPARIFGQFYNMPKKKRSSVKSYKSNKGKSAAAFMATGKKARDAGRAKRAAYMGANAATMGYMGIEKKFYDTSFSGAIAAATDATGGEYDPSTTSMITTPDQGDGPSQRDGKRITCKYIEIKGTLSTPAVELQANTPAYNKVFLALVLDTQTNGAQMNSEDCFKNTAAVALSNAAPLRNLLFGSRFKVLKQKVFDVTPITLSHFAIDSFSWAGRQQEFHWYVPLNDLPVNFNLGTTASIANVIDNSVHVIAYSTTTQVTLTYNARLRFVG